MEKLLITFNKFIKEKAWQHLKNELAVLEPVVIAEIIEQLEETDAIVVFRLLKREQAKEVFQHLSHEQQEDIINALANNSERIADLLNDLDPDDRTAFLEELPGKVSQRL
ncbi:MAG: magnesium transporter, partial [Bacteroidales bacterium]|nr:magnesium transporter [Bacteroidales bacterium]